LSAEGSTSGAGDLIPWPEGVARHILAEVDSTNSEAARLAPGLSMPTWVLARKQTAARGRRGRAWANPEGNFAASLVLYPQGGPAAGALFSFVAALALDAALARVCPPATRLSIKWPNDVLLNGGKIAGILLESGGGTNAAPAPLIIGIGVNLAEAPDPGQLEAGAMAPVSLKGETGVVLSPEEFLPFLATEFQRFQAQYDTYGFTPIRNAWLARAARLGTQITARTVRETHEGIFETIDDQGALVLMTPKGRIAISAADVFF
jgi:BirA family transcriptional regulator, biotin operon repressor / biotin---[acetyl-CoA-carboxylase] ligase